MRKYFFEQANTLGKPAFSTQTLAHQQGGKVLGDDDSAAGAVVKSLEGFFFHIELKGKNSLK